MITINTPFFGTDENCQEATADFKERFEKLCPYVTIDYSRSWWGRADRSECDPPPSDEQWEEIKSIWEQVSREISDEYGS
jgi:hypothetical protein